MIHITRTIAPYESEIQQKFIRAPPGGQNVTKVATAKQLRFDVVNSQSLPDDVRKRLILPGWQADYRRRHIDYRSPAFSYAGAEQTKTQSTV